MPKLCAAGIQLRNQIDDDYPDRDRKSDGWVADARHLAKGSSDHIPDARGIVRALDIDSDLSARSHFHISFTTLGDKDGSYFNLEGETNERPKEDGRELGKDIPSNSTSDISSSRPRCRCNCQCRSSVSLA
jgi:hypothetical protein